MFRGIQPLEVLRQISLWLLLAAAITGAVLVAAIALEGRVALRIGPWRLTGHDCYRPAAIALTCAGLYGLIGARHRRWDKRIAVCLGAILAAAAIAAAIAIRERPQGVAMGDAAIAELYVLYAAKFSCLTGPYSQFGWNHPGPAMFYLLAPLYSVAGHHPAALSLGALVINIAALAGATYLAAAACPGRGTIAVALGFGLWAGRAPDVLTSYWNPHLLVFPTFAFLWLAVSVSLGRIGLLPLLMAVGSFLAQTHVGAVPLVGGVSLASVVLFGRRARTSGGPAPEWRRAANASAWTLVAIWAFPLAEQLASSDGGNLSLLLRFFVWEQPAVQPVASYGVGAWALASTGPLMPGFHLPVGWPMPNDTSSGTIAVALLQLAGLIAVARHRSSEEPIASAALIMAVGQALTLVSAVRIPGLIADHAVFWFGAVGTTGWAILLSAAASRWSSASRSVLVQRLRAPRWATVTVAATSLAIGIPPMLATVAESRQIGAAAEVQAITPMVARGLAAQRILKPLVRIDDKVWLQAAGVLLALYKQGHGFSVERRWQHVFEGATTHTVCGHSHVLTLGPAGAPSTGAIIGRAGGLEARLAPSDNSDCHGW